MYPDLSYLLHDIFPTFFERDGAFSVVKMFGLMLAMAFVASAYTCGLELMRKEKQGLLLPKTMKVVTGKPPSVSDMITNGCWGL